jgi:hypothetical protein
LVLPLHYYFSFSHLHYLYKYLKYYLLLIATALLFNKLFFVINFHLFFVPATATIWQFNRVTFLIYFVLYLTAARTYSTYLGGLLSTGSGTANWLYMAVVILVLLFSNVYIYNLVWLYNFISLPIITLLWYGFYRFKSGYLHLVLYAAFFLLYLNYLNIIVFFNYMIHPLNGFSNFITGPYLFSFLRSDTPFLVLLDKDNFVFLSKPLAQLFYNYYQYYQYLLFSVYCEDFILIFLFLALLFIK